MTDQVITRAPLSDPISQGGNWYRKTVSRREGQLYFKPLAGKPISYTKHTVTLDNGHVLRKSCLAFKKVQPLSPNRFSSGANTLVSKNDLAGKRNRNSPLNKLDSNDAGPTIAHKPTGSSSTKSRKTKTSISKGFNFVNSGLSSPQDLDHWDNVLEDYLGNFGFRGVKGEWSICVILAT